MADNLRATVQQLGDLELAVLVSLVAQQHCLLFSRFDSIDFQDKLRLICSATFGLDPVTVECSSDTTIEQFSDAVLVQPSSNLDHTSLAEDLHNRPLLGVNFSSLSNDESHDRHGSTSTLDNRRIGHVIIATHLDLASEGVQVQALELIRTKRIFTRTAMHTAPKELVVLAIGSRPGARLSHHLNDVFFMSYLDGDAGAPQLALELPKSVAPVVSSQRIADLRALAERAHHTAEIAAYLHNIVVFMRNSRYIAGGVTATATRDVRMLAKVLAPLHGLAYVPPSLVALAVRKVYPHRLILANADNEVSLQWGSERDAVARMLDGITVEDAIEDVLASVDTPL